VRQSYFMPLSALWAVITFVLQVSVADAGQAAAAKTNTPAVETAKTWTPPRTRDGHPQLRGIWSFATIPLLQRAPDLGTSMC
jgi:hypothetical protein